MSNTRGLKSIWAVRRKVIRPILRVLIKIAFAVLIKYEVIGRENIPAEGPLIIIGNHFNFIDPVIFIRTFSRQIEFIGGTELPNAPPIVRFIPKLWGVFKVHRGSVSREALDNAEKILAGNGTLGIFPEAGSWAAVLKPARPGAALLAVRSQALILPVGLDGTANVFPYQFARRKKITVRIGKPFGPFDEDIRGRAGRERLEEIGHEMMHRIRDLIPPETHGYYSDDPAIREAAKGTEIYPWDDMLEN